MTIGVFDSGVGGLLMARAFRAALPTHDFLYLGDTLHVPYGPRSAAAIYDFTLRGITYLFDQGCPLIVIACNTASASALRRLQQDYLPRFYTNRRILGVIVPTLEAIHDGQHHRVGMLGTAFTVQSGVYRDELAKINPHIQLHAVATPLLVPLVEQNALQYAKPVLADYLTPLLTQGIDSLVLGCTHYPRLKSLLADMLPTGVTLISQDDVVPPKLADYLARHPELDAQIGRSGAMRVALSDLSPTYEAIGQELFGEALQFEKVRL